MEYNKLEYYISQPRIERFLTATNNSKTKAKKLYKINLRVAQSFYPILNLFEIFFRNTINYQISAYFANPNWIITEKNGFMNNRTLAPSRYFLKNSVLSAERKIRNRGRSITSGKIIAEQSFGFWSSFFEPHHYRLIGGSVIHCFANKPKEVNRNSISQKLNKIRVFRNRIYHNEPICFKQNEIDFTEAVEIKQEIYDLLNWIDVDLTKYIEYFDNIERKIKMADKLVTVPNNK
jgi:hypothetical protein